MAHQRMGFIYFVLFTAISNAASVCLLKLKPDSLFIKSGSNPLIYKYEFDGTPIIHYPSDRYDNCIFPSANQKIHLACPGTYNALKILLFGSFSEPIYSTAKSNFVYLQLDPSDSHVLVVHGAGTYRVNDRGPFLYCLEKPVATMQLLNTTRDTESKGYAVGYRLNDVDFLKVYEQEYITEEWIVTRYKIDPSIPSRPVFDYNNEYKKGLFFQKKIINFHHLYAKEYQVAEFQRHFNNMQMTRNYFEDDNLLVMGQLMLDEDAFYYSDQISTRFYENTAPIWKSVYEGNWRTVGSAVRNIADATARGLDVQVCAWPSYQFNRTTWLLGNTSSSPDTTIPVPRLLVKVAVDVVNSHLGFVYHTFNDPHLDRKVAEEQVGNYCTRTSNCQELHPEFQNMYEGYTFCCKPKDSYIFKKIKGY